MNNARTRLSETLSLTAWSQALTGTRVLATYSFDGNGRFVDIQPSCDIEHYFKGIGLQKKTNGYELDTLDAPIGSVAKAFGFNYDDPAIRQMLNDKTGGDLNSESLSALAKMGYAQLGNIVSPEHSLLTHYQINLDQVVHVQASVIPSMLFSTGSVEGNGLQRDSVLLMTDAETLQHGYLVTCTSGNHKMDRLALYVATNKGLAEIEGLSANQFIGFKRTANGHRVALFVDPTKPEIKINEFTTSGRESKGVLNVPRVLIDARSSSLPASSALRTGSTELMSKFLIARHLKELVQDGPINLMSNQYNAPMISEGKLTAGPLSVSQDITLRDYKDRAKLLMSKLNQRVHVQASLFGHKLDQPQQNDVVKAITHAVLDTFRHAVETCSSLERLETLGKSKGSAHPTAFAKHNPREDGTFSR